MDGETGTQQSESVCPLSHLRAHRRPQYLSPASLSRAPHWAGWVEQCLTGRSCKPKGGSTEGRRQDPSSQGPMAQGPFWGANPPCLCQRDVILENLPLQTHCTVRKRPGYSDWS